MSHDRKSCTDQSKSWKLAELAESETLSKWTRGPRIYVKAIAQLAPKIEYSTLERTQLGGIHIRKRFLQPITTTLLSWFFLHVLTNGGISGSTPYSGRSLVWSDQDQARDNFTHEWRGRGRDEGYFRVLCVIPSPFTTLNHPLVHDTDSTVACQSFEGAIDGEGKQDNATWRQGYALQKHRGLLVNVVMGYGDRKETPTH